MFQQAVLVVDPNPATHRRVTEAFAGSAWTVVAARDLPQATQHAAEHELALVLVAASLPGGNGYDFARELLGDQPNAAVLLMTGGYEIYNSGRAEAAGVRGHLAKPFSAEGLRTAAIACVGAIPEPQPELPAPAPAAPTPTQPSPVSAPIDPPLSGERIATLLPRTYEELPLVAVDPEVVSPALERAVLEVLPEVVEAVLRQTLHSSPAFRDLVAVAVEEAVRAQLPAIAARVVDARLAELEAIDD